MKRIRCLNLFGFTLAEILITLGIIGVVASITVPILTTAYVNAQKSAGIRKALSTMANAYTMAKLDSGGDFNCTYLKDASGNVDGTLTQTSGCIILWQALKTELKAVKTCDYNASANYFGECFPPDGIDDSSLSGGCQGFNKSKQQIANSMVLSDGTYLYPYGSYGFPLFAYDINGFKGPNKYGSDVFAFMILENKMLPAGTLNSGCINTVDYITGIK